MARMFSAHTVGVGAILALASTAVTACESEPEAVEQETRFQCGIERPDGTEEAVDCDSVNDNDGSVLVSGIYYPVFIHAYSHSAAGGLYAPGTALPKDSGRHRIAYKDAAGRQNWGLPPAGRIANNTVKTNVIGKGGAPVPRSAVGNGKVGGGGGKSGGGSGGG